MSAGLIILFLSDVPREQVWGRPAERAALLEAADPTVREEVEKMLTAHQGASPLDHPPVSTTGTRASTARWPVKVPAEQFTERFEREAPRHCTLEPFQHLHAARRWPRLPRDGTGGGAERRRSAASRFQ